MGYYIVNSDVFTLHEDIITYGQVINASELTVRSEYLSSTKSKTNWYWEQK